MKKILLILVLAYLNCNLSAFSKHAHLNGYKIAGIKDLIGTSVKKGGIGNISIHKLSKINDWIDNPTKHIGEYINHKAGGKLIHPLNHGNLRHNPFSVSKVFSGSGKIDGSALNVARMHKIQDIFNNKAVVDGWKPTLQMKKKAEAILRYAGRYKKLPVKRLPEWVDKSGPLMTGMKGGNKIKVAGLVSKTSKINRVSKITKTFGKVVLPAAIVLDTSIVIYKVVDVEKQYNAGKINIYERNIQHGQNICGGAASISSLLIGSAILAVTPAGPVVFVVVGGVIVGSYLFDYAGKVVRGYVMKKYNNYLRQNEEYYAGLYENFFNNIETCSLSEKDLRECGFSDYEIKKFVK